MPWLGRVDGLTLPGAKPEMYCWVVFVDTAFCCLVGIRFGGRGPKSFSSVIFSGRLAGVFLMNMSPKKVQYLSMCLPLNRSLAT